MGMIMGGQSRMTLVIVLVGLLSLALLVPSTDAFLKIGKRHSADVSSDEDLVAEQDEASFEPISEKRVAELSRLVNDLKALKELKAIVNAKSLSTRNARELFIEDDKN